MAYTIVVILLTICSILLISVILLQRGKGGGLAGAFGAGGEAEMAFGAKAATLAQKVTVVLGALLIVLGLTAWYMRARANASGANAQANTQQSSQR